MSGTAGATAMTRRRGHALQALVAAAAGIALAVYQTGCVAVMPTDGHPTPMTRDELAGVWIAPGYEDSVWRLELRPDGTGTLSTALLEEISGLRRQSTANVTRVEFKASAGETVITTESSDHPGTGEILRLKGCHEGLQLWGTSQWFAPNVPGGASELEIMFVRESPMLEAMKLVSEREPLQQSGTPPTP